ncbi:hypothetical protein EZV62_017873 [Acer yangbiense]|uniref:Transmembrane protein n=1 Tax=Acer yangbiense TaxID=1000413 RepID=A0A5C7HHN9_9ROSI|nr:hypothetical protein EZV62_017873 [Acer yangbiense]
MDRSQIADQEELNLNEWEQIQSPSPSPSLNIIQATPPRELDMVAIRDSYLQDSLSLQVSSQPNSPPSSSSSSSSSSDVSSSNLRDRVAVNEVGRQLSLRLKILRSGIVRIAAKIRYCAAVYVGGFWSFAAMTGLVATVLLSLLYTRLRRKVRQVENNNNSLILLIKEKDQKINQLLLQVSQMNELLSRRRKVTVIRIGGSNGWMEASDDEDVDAFGDELMNKVSKR